MSKLYGKFEFTFTDKISTKHWNIHNYFTDFDWYFLIWWCIDISFILLINIGVSIIIVWYLLFLEISAKKTNIFKSLLSFVEFSYIYCVNSSTNLSNFFCQANFLNFIFYFSVLDEKSPCVLFSIFFIFYILLFFFN